MGTTLSRVVARSSQSSERVDALVSPEPDPVERDAILRAVGEGTPREPHGRTAWWRAGVEENVAGDVTPADAP